MKWFVMELLRKMDTFVCHKMCYQEKKCGEWVWMSWCAFQQPECRLLIVCRKNHLCSPDSVVACVCIYCAIILDNDGDIWLDFFDCPLSYINADTTLSFAILRSLHFQLDAHHLVFMNVVATDSNIKSNAIDI